MGGMEEGGIHTGTGCGDLLGINHDQAWRVPVHQVSDCRRHPLSIEKKKNESEACGGEKL